MQPHKALGLAAARLEGLSSRAWELLVWYGQHRRAMPWRGTDAHRPPPYHVWVSEIMLQQTRVEAARGYYTRFLAALPTIAALAGASEDALLKLWEGLGYYSRARNLQKAARIVMERHGGELPADFALLRALPGIGDYTAGAIASMAFGIPVPAPDGNVYRVLSRLLGSAANVGDASVKAALGQIAAAMQPQARPGDFNQALMELGALVCLPNGAPLCQSCPWAASCVALAEGCQNELPVLPAKKPRRVEERTILIVEAGGCILLARRPAKGLLAGLPEPLNLPGTLTPEQAADAVTALGAAACEVTPLGWAKHIFTHVEWHMTGYRIAAAPFAPPDDSFFWANAGALQHEWAIPSAFKAYL